MRVGFFGGTFDPPHEGHLAVARAAAESFSLDRVLLVPTGRQPLKAEPPEAAFRDRFAMVLRLCEGASKLDASDLEAPSASAEPNYTIDTLLRLRVLLKPDDLIFVIVGADAFLGIRSWRDSDRLLTVADWIVVSRPGFSLAELGALQLSEEQRAKVHLLTNIAVPVSATDLRRRLQQGDDCHGLIPSNVLGYIGAHDLYRRV